MNYLSFEDAWIFLGLKYAENESADYYARLINFFDDINNSVPGYEEFISAYNKLLYIGAIKNEQGRIHVMAFGNSIYKNVLNKSLPGAPLREVAELICMELKPYKLKSACRQAPISAQEYDAFIKLYKAKKLASA